MHSSLHSGVGECSIGPLGPPLSFSLCSGFPLLTRALDSVRKGKIMATVVKEGDEKNEPLMKC